MSDFEDKNLDILQNIESAIVSIYRVTPDLSDYEVDKALSALWDSYHVEGLEKTYAPPAMNENTDAVFAIAQTICDWRLGREGKSETENSQPFPDISPTSVDVILAYLKRIRKSVAKWTKRGGRQGYVRFISDFIP
jgi:hypothetical protein